MKRILIVEDEVALRLAIRYQLKLIDPQIETVEARNPLEASQQLEDGSPLHAAVIDLRLATHDGINNDAGFAVIKLLSLRRPPVPVVILSARNDFDALDGAKEISNVRFFFTKPWNSEDFQRHVGECLSGRATGFQSIGEFEDSNNAN